MSKECTLKTEKCEWGRSRKSEWVVRHVSWTARLRTVDSESLLWTKSGPPPSNRTLPPSLFGGSWVRSPGCESGTPDAVGPASSWVDRGSRCWTGPPQDPAAGTLFLDLWPPGSQEYPYISSRQRPSSSWSRDSTQFQFKPHRLVFSRKTLMSWF